MIFRDLETERLYLKNINMEDAQFILEEFSDDDINHYLYDAEPMVNIGEAVELIQFYTESEPRLQHRWILVLKENDEKIGTCGFHCWDKGKHEVEVGYDMKKAYWKKGYMYEAMAAVLSYGRKELDIKSFLAQIYPENENSKALAVKLGFELTTNIVNQEFRGKNYEHHVYRNQIAEKNALIINCSPVCTGATAEIVKIVSEQLSNKYNTKSICIDDYKFAFCKGCRSCHATAKCIQNDDIDVIMYEFEWADIIVSVAPSYWADIPGQYKAFIDRCTPWCDTHEPHAEISSGKKGYAIALRTGPGTRECDRIIESIEHFYGHLEIACHGKLGLCSIEHKENVQLRKKEIVHFCEEI